MQTRHLLLTAGLLLSATSAHAQSPAEATKSADQITCELTGDCGDDQLAPEQDRGETRGFSIARMTPPAHALRPVAARPTSAPSAARNASYAAPQVQPSMPGRRERLIAPIRKPAMAARPKAAARPAVIGASNLAVGFALGSATLDSAGRLQAEALLAALRGPRLEGRHVVIAGHTDSIGGRDYNIDLSQRRARALADYLADNGISRDLLDPVGYGYDRPLPGLSASEPRNRRVEIVLADKPRP